MVNPAILIAAFDFDGTLTRRDTLLPFLRRGLGWPRFLLALLRCSPWLTGYALKCISNDVAKARLLQATLKGKSSAEVQDWTARWLAHDFSGQLQDWTMGRLAWHQKAGHCCVMVSASPNIYLERVARQLGFDALICTEMEEKGGYLTGQLSTPNCYGEQKVLRLRAWLVSHFGDVQVSDITLYAYGDTAGDKPMLKMARHAWYKGKPWGGKLPRI